MYPTKKLWEVCEIQNWYAFKAIDYDDTESVRIIRIWNVQKWFILDKSPCFVSQKIFEENKIFSINENDILISLTWDVWRVWIFPKKLLPALLNQRVWRFFSFKKEIDTNYLFHFLNSNFFEEEIIRTSSWAAQKNTSTKKILEIPIPLPPLSTQKLIVEKLDNIFAENQKLKNLYQAQIKNLDEMKQSFLKKAFAGELV